MPLQFTREHTQVLKGIAILMMILHHVLIPEFYVAPNAILSNVAVAHLMIGGKFCVAIFTFIIGYGYFYRKQTAAVYAFRHIRQLLLKYWLLLFVVFIPISQIFDTKLILLNMLGASHQYNCANWYVYFYIWAMIALPFISRASLKHPKATLLTLTAASTISCITPPDSATICTRMISNCALYTPLLALGYIAARSNIMKRYEVQPQRLWLYLLAAVVILLARCAKSFLFGFCLDIILAPLFIYITVAILNIVKTNFLTKFLSALGALSLYMWFIHAAFFSNFTRSTFQTSAFWPDNHLFIFLIVTFSSFIIATFCSALERTINKLSAHD